MPSTFNVHNADGYDRLMGRWSQKLAPQFVAFAGLSPGERILDVGCGTGSLTFVLAKNIEVADITAIDYSSVFVKAASQRNTDPRIKISQADACALPFEDGTFDRALALLVLHFIPQADKAISEMRRVVRPHGVVAAAVWDHLGGMPGMRMMIDTIAALSEGGRRLRNHYCFQPMTKRGEMKRAFIEQGLAEVTETELLIRMDYTNFDDYWMPIAAGEGPLGKFVTDLAPADLAQAEAAVRDAYEGGETDGPRSFANIAWACRGIVPPASDAGI